MLWPSLSPLKDKWINNFPLIFSIIISIEKKKRKEQKFGKKKKVNIK